MIYDDARCRGSDLQLRKDAVGMLSIGPGVCKDKLMQAAGRMRLLGNGQRLVFLSTQEVTAAIRHACSSSSKHGSEMQHMGAHNHQGQQQVESAFYEGQTDSLTSWHVLVWVMGNSRRALQQGIVEWAAKGLHYAGGPSCFCV